MAKVNSALSQKKYEVGSSIDIDAPQSVVWNLLKDFGGVQNWAPSVTKSYYLSSQESGVGTGRHCDIKGFGSIQEYVTEWDEGNGFTYRVTPLGPLDESLSRWQLIPVSENKTRLKVSLKYDVRFGLFGKLMHRLIMRKKLEAALPETLVATKQHLTQLELAHQRHLKEVNSAA
ncbi:MAG: SRPBCC family protein [Kangiellaceae bacterium]|nr:SRPBCC family protein [Kangiellaceae bacterium]